MRLRKIKVYGQLRQFLGQSTFEAAVKTPQQAVNFLKANFEGIEKHMSNQIYKIKMGGMDIEKKYLNMSGSGDIQIIPVAIGADFLFDFVGDVFDTAFDFVGDVFNFVVDNALNIGLTLISGGTLSTVALTLGLGLAADLLSPQQPAIPTSNVGDTDPRIRGSYNFSGIQNISSAGVQVPIIYGKVFSGSIIISSGVDTAQFRGAIT